MSEDTAKRESDDLLRQLQEEQRRTSSMSQEISSSSSSRQSLSQAQEKINDLLKDNSILREANEKLLNSAFDIERERKFMFVVVGSIAGIAPLFCNILPKQLINIFNRYRFMTSTSKQLEIN